MNEEVGRRVGTILLHGPASAAPASRDGVPAAFAITPEQLADLMLLAPMARGAGLASLDPDGETSTLSVQRKKSTLAEIRVTADVGNAAVARLAVIARLDPLAEASSLEGNRNVARTVVRAGRDVAELLVSVGASRRGLAAEVRPLSINGRAPDLGGGGQLQRCTRCGALQAAVQEVCDVDGGALVEVLDAPRIGGTIGAYRILTRLGEGGGGVVFAGEHALLGRPVAIKLLHRSLAADPALAQRFLSEARAASRLRHPGVVDVTDFGVLRDGRPYMVMERLAGEPLGARLSREGALEPTVALLIAREAALALGAAHEAGIAHNDLKPSNVVLLEGSTDEAPRLKLIDFGAASLVGTADEHLFGTPEYMAPERVLGDPSDGRADLYSLGVMLYEMLTGAPPFAGMALGELLLAHVRKPLPRLHSRFGVLPPAVARVVTRAVAKQAGERCQSAAEMAADIDGALDALGRDGSRRWLP